MKYKKNKSRLIEMQGVYFSVKFGLVFIYALNVNCKKYSSIYIERKYFQLITCTFILKRKDFSVENLETTPSIFLSKFSSEIYLSRIINYQGGIQYSVWLVFCPYFFFLSSFSSFAISIFRERLTGQQGMIHRIAGNGEGIIIFLVFHFHLLRRFQPLLFNRSICNYQIDC